MIENKLDAQAIFTSTLSAIQTSVSNYPTYNLFTQIQDSIRARLLQEVNNPLNSFGQKYFSQNDEDGILLEILKRIGLLDKKQNRSRC